MGFGDAAERSWKDLHCPSIGLVILHASFVPGLADSVAAMALRIRVICSLHIF